MLLWVVGDNVLTWSLPMNLIKLVSSGLFYVTNPYASIPVTNSVNLKETYKYCELLLNKIKYPNYAKQFC